MSRDRTAGSSALTANGLGQRIIIIGDSCSGKSTLGERLAGMIGAPFVELDALYWQPEWTPTPDDEFGARLAAATASERWVVAGNYQRHTMGTIWPRADTVIWLDFPLMLVTWRIIRRSWRRWRSNELLWGTNTEAFWRQLKLWDQESLITFTLTNHRHKRATYQAAMRDQRWSHISFRRLRRAREVDELVRGLGGGISDP